MTSTLWLHIAATISLVTLIAHIFGGGKSAAQPLLASGLDDEAKLTNYYCWHMVTIIIAFMCLCFALTAGGYTSADLAVAATLLAALFTLWSIGLIFWKKQKVTTLPQWILFLPIAITGGLGAF